MGHADASSRASDGAAWEQVEQVVAGLRATLGTNLLGAYLHGSLALGSFNPLRSDLDILAVTRAAIPLGDRAAVARCFLTLSKRPYPIEISILAVEHLHPWWHPALYDFHFSEDGRAATEDALVSGVWREWKAPVAGDPDLAAHVIVTRACGVALLGPPIEEVFPVVPRADYLDSIAADVLDARYGLDGAAGIAVYRVLNACRTWAYLRTGAVLSKAEGGAWALGELPADLRPVVRSALEAYATGGYPDELPAAEVKSFAAFVRPVLLELGLHPNM